MPIPLRFTVSLAGLALLSGCGGNDASGEQAKSGTVLEGTVSDAMLPVDTLRSQPPLADPAAAAQAQEKATGKPASGPAAASSAKPAAATPTEAEAEPAPAAAPAEE